MGARHRSLRLSVSLVWVCVSEHGADSCRGGRGSIIVDDAIREVPGHGKAYVIEFNYGLSTWLVSLVEEDTAVLTFQ